MNDERSFDRTFVILTSISCYMNFYMITTYQSGFRSLHSTATALLEATNSWAYNVDRGNVNAVVFLDLKKAFTDDTDLLMVLTDDTSLNYTERA